MPRVTCRFCGLPFSVRSAREGVDYYCCSGCALASRIPVRDDGLPISRELVIALALGFGLFNQLLFGVLGQAVIAEGHADVGERWLLVSAAIGAVLFAVNLVFVVTAPTRHGSDAVTGLVTVAFVVWAVQRGATGHVAAACWIALGTNLGMAAWWLRGWARRGLARWRGRGGGVV